jgi:glycerol-3-phosphate dehydrogenase
VEDFLSRRSRALLLDARASIDMADETARLMAEELGKDDAWASEQASAYKELAKEYLLA